MILARAKGTVLLTVLLLVTVMATVAVWLSDRARYGIHRTVNLREVTQARWYALGAEALARQGLYTAWRADPGRTPPVGPWNGDPLEFPIEGGMIRAVLSDQATCFNLNGVVKRVGGGILQADLGGMAVFARLLTRVAEISPPDARQYAALLTDYIDTDATPLPSGGEDYTYASQKPPRRTAGGLLVHTTELLAVPGIKPELYGLLRPWVCALPEPGNQRLALPLMTPEHAPLLAALVGGELTPGKARDALGSAPRGGWQSLEDFWGHRAFAGMGISPEIRNQVVLRAQDFALEVQVVYHRAEFRLSTQLEVSASGVLRVTGRSFGEGI